MSLTYLACICMVNAALMPVHYLINGKSPKATSYNTDVDIHKKYLPLMD